MFIDNSYSISSSLHERVVLGPCVPCRAKQDASTGQGKQWEVGAMEGTGWKDARTRKEKSHIQIYVQSGMDLDAVGVWNWVNTRLSPCCQVDD